MSERGRQGVAGVIGLFDEPESLLRAAARVRDAGYRNWDCHTPYPVHGLDEAMGLRPSPVPALCLTAGFAGAAVAMLTQWWMSAVDYPVMVGGKPMFSWPAFLPITFEFFVLFAALATMASLILFCRLGRWHSPLHDAGVMGEVTTRRFGIVLGAADPAFTPEAARALLAGAGCRDVRTLEAPAEADARESAR